MHPDLRATIRRDGIVRAVPWGPHFELCGPTATLLDARDRAGVTIADLSIVRDDEDGPASEVIVEFLAGADRTDAHDTLIAWASLLGYHRVWLPTELRQLDPADHAEHGFGGKVEARCTGCRGRLVDGTPAFWEWVRTLGFFPSVCPVCGGDLPQWQEVAGSVRTTRSASVTSRSSPTTLDTWRDAQSS